VVYRREIVDQDCELSFVQQREQLCSPRKDGGTFMITILVLSAMPAASILGASGAYADPDIGGPPTGGSGQVTGGGAGRDLRPYLCHPSG
jgi:hypothetical protein